MGKILSTTTKRVISEYADAEDADRHELFLGVCSNHLCDLRPGDEVLVAGPNGKGFLLPEAPEQHNYIFLATAPASRCFGVLSKTSKGNRLVHQDLADVGRALETDLLYREELEALAEARQPGIALGDQPREPPPRPRSYVHDRLEREWTELESRFTDPNAMVYACGLAGMQVGVFQTLAQRGLAGQFLKIDRKFAAMNPSEWDAARIKRFVRRVPRTKLGVY